MTLLVGLSFSDHENEAFISFGKVLNVEVGGFCPTPRMLDPEQFLSDYGLRSMLRGLTAEPYNCHGSVVAYEPAESTTPMYGGNSNWRGPVWFPVNFLMIEALREYHRYFGDSLRAELPMPWVR